MTMEKRIVRWATLALILAPLLTARAEAGPLFEAFSQPHYAPGYSCLHYWLPGIYRVHACLQPLPPDSPPIQPLHGWGHRDGHLRGDRCDSAIPASMPEMTPASDNAPAAPR
jgi:hypothetical protein